MAESKTDDRSEVKRHKFNWTYRILDKDIRVRVHKELIPSGHHPTDGSVLPRRIDSWVDEHSDRRPKLKGWQIDFMDGFVEKAESGSVFIIKSEAGCTGKSTMLRCLLENAAALWKIKEIILSHDTSPQLVYDLFRRKLIRGELSPDELVLITIQVDKPMFTQTCHGIRFIDSLRGGSVRRENHEDISLTPPIIVITSPYKPSVTMPYWHVFDVDANLHPNPTGRTLQVPRAKCLPPGGEPA